MNALKGSLRRLGLLGRLRRMKWAARVQARRWRQQARFGRSARGELPRVFANAMAKSGSHILSQFLEGMERISPLVYTDPHPIRTLDGGGRERPAAEVLTDLNRLRTGDMAWGYLPAREPYLRWVKQEAPVTFFIYRDPRDRIISHIFYATEIHEGHAMRDYYRDIPSMEARIEATIRGVPGLVESIRDSYQSYLGWLEQEQVVKVRFEDLVNDRRATVGTLLAALEARGVVLDRPRQEAIERLVEAMAPRHSPTFRSGTSGGWRQHFTAANIAQLKAAAGDLLVKLGYEQDSDW